MSKILVALLAILLVTALGLFLLLENPDEFKPQIEDVVRSSTGYDVSINGELSWRYWPPVAIRVEQISLSQGSDTPIASFDHIEVDVNLMPLLQQQRLLDIGLISIGGGSINLVVDPQGRANWDLPDSAGSQTASRSGSEAPDVSTTPLESTVQELRVENVSLSYDDQLLEEQYQLNIESLTTSAISIDHPFQMDMIVQISDRKTDFEGNASISSEVLVHSVNERVLLNGLSVSMDATVEGMRLSGLNLSANTEIRTREQVISLEEGVLTLAGSKTAISGLINFAGDEPRFDGHIDFTARNLSELKTLLDVELPITQLQIASNVVGSPSTVTFNNLNGNFDGSAFSGQSRLNLGTPVKGQLDLRLPVLNLDQLISDETASGNAATISTAGASTFQDSEIIPLNDLRENHMDVIVRVEALTMAGYQLTNAKIESHNTAEALDLTVNGQGMGGEVLLTMDSDLSRSPMESYVNLSMDALDIKEITEVEGITGKLSGNSSTSFIGTSLEDINDTITGKSLFTVQDGTLDVRPLKEMAGVIDTLRGKTSSISEWPDIMPFKRLAAEHVLSEGFAAGQILQADVENLNITALGGFDLTSETVAYDVTATFRPAEDGQFKVSDQLTNIRWPLTCEGTFTDTPANLCFGQEGAITNLVAAILKQDFERRGKDKLNELIDEKAPEELRDLLKGLFK